MDMNIFYNMVVLYLVSAIVYSLIGVLVYTDIRRFGYDCDERRFARGVIMVALLPLVNTMAVALSLTSIIVYRPLHESMEWLK